MELDEINRLISKCTWDRFQLDMDKLEYRRRNSNLEHRIKMLHLQLNVPKVTISKKIPGNYRMDHKRFELEFRNTLQLNELKHDKIKTIKQNYSRMVHDIHKNSNEIIGMFENLSTVKKKRYFENEIHSVRQKLHQLENFITVLKQQLNETRYNHENFVCNFVLGSVVYWKSVTTVLEQIQNYYRRLNELCNDIKNTRKDVTIIENQVGELRKVYEHLNSEIELQHSQLPRIIAKLPITYNSLELKSNIIDSPASGTSPNTISDLKRIQIIENILIQPANQVMKIQPVIDLGGGLIILDENIQSKHDNASGQDPKDIQIDEAKTQLFRKRDKSKKSTKRSNSSDNDQSILSCKTRSLQKKSKITAEQEKYGENTVETLYSSPRKLRSRKIPDSKMLPQPIETAEVVQLSPKQHFGMAELNTFSSKASPMAAGPNISLLSNFQPNPLNSDSFLLNTLSDHGSCHTSTDSKEDAFFITNEGDGFNFFQSNDDDKLFSM